MFTRVLVPLDGGPQGILALEVAERLAKAWGADVDTLALLEHGDRVERREKTIAQQAAHLQRRGLTAMRTVEYTVGDEIADEFEVMDGTIVVMCTSAHSRASAVVDSVADDVLRYIDGPVVLIGPNVSVSDAWPTGPLIVCTDGSPWAESILPHSAAVAEGLGVTPWVVTVVDPAYLPADVGTAAEANYPASLAKSLEESMSVEVNFEVLHGSNPAERIVEYANARKAAMIALATHGRTGLRRFVMGSVAMKVAHDATCPVLVAQPRD